MSLHPILAALRKHKAGVALIALQIALTLAIVCNAVFIIGQRIQRVDRPTGLDESNLFLVSQQWVGAPTGDDAQSVDKLDSMLRADLDTIRRIPGVASVTTMNSIPLLNSSWTGSLSTKPGSGEIKGDLHTAYYFGDENMLKTLGVRLIAGRGFRADDVSHRGFRDEGNPAVVIVTKAIADKLFPGGAVGKTVYLNGSTKPSTIVGVVARMQVPATGSWANSFTWYSTLVPVRLNANFSRYLVRTQPGQLDAVMHAVTPALYKTQPLRVLDDDSVRSFARIRERAYRSDVGMAVLMGIICLILVAVTSAGIVGLTSFWVGQRRKQIGVRRALGARRIDIMRYFQTENLMISGGGAVLGVGLAVGLNSLLMRHFEMSRLPILYVLLGVVLVVGLSQAAVFVPARKASKVSPAEATRSV